MTWHCAWGGGDSVPASLAHMCLAQQESPAAHGGHCIPTWGEGGRRGERERKGHQAGRPPSVSVLLGGGAIWTSSHSHTGPLSTGSVLPPPSLRLGILDGKPGCHVGRSNVGGRRRGKQKWAVFTGAQRGIPKVDDLGPVGARGLEEAARKAS